MPGGVLFGAWAMAPAGEMHFQAGEVTAEEAFTNQLVEIMVFTSSQLSLGRYFYSFMWFVVFFFSLFSFSELVS